MTATPKKILITIGGPPNTAKGILAREIARLLLTNHGIHTLPVVDTDGLPEPVAEDYQGGLKSLIAGTESGELQIEFIEVHVSPRQGAKK